MKNVYAYIRVSTVRQGQHGSSLEEQRGAITTYAQRQGLEIAAWYEERETAAKRGRTVFTRMLAALDLGKAQGVVIHKIDRGARNLRDWADLAELIDRGTEVHLAHESLDLGTRGGRLSADIQAVVAADFIRNLRDEVRKGFYGRLKQGLYPLPAPLGYLDQGRGLPKTIDPMAGPLLRHLFDSYATGDYSLDTLKAEADRLGLRGKCGGDLSRSSLARTLGNSFYIGLIRIHRTDESFLGIHEPLISKALFDRVQDVLAGRVRSHGARHRYLFQKLLTCAACGHLLTGERQKGHVYYRCHAPACVRVSLREEVIDQALRMRLADVSLPEKLRPAIMNELREFERDWTMSHEQLLQGANFRIGELTERLNRLTDAFIDASIDKAAFDERKRSLLEERITLQEQQARLRDQSGPIPRRMSEFFELVLALRHNYEMANHEEKRLLIKATISNLMVERKNVVVAWREPFGELANTTKTACGEPYRNELRTGLKESMPKIARHLSNPITLKHLSPYIREEPERKLNPGWKNVEEFNERRSEKGG